MKSNNSSAKNKALKIFSNEYDSKLDGSLASDISQRRKGKKECYFVDIVLKYQDNIN